MTDAEERRVPPDGAVCGTHPERPALATCPRCGNHVCLACWHHAVGRCQECLLRDPLAAAEPIAWEAPERRALARLLGTLASAFRPTRSAPAFARSEVRRAAWFALFVAVPLAALRGVIPFTHTLAFGDGFEVNRVGSPTGAEIALDVLRAMGLSVGMTAALFVALCLPFVSLARAYGRSPYRNAALRMMLYRAWLLPVSMFGLPFWLAVWAAPEGTADSVASVAAMVEFVPLLLLFVAMRSTARLAHGVGPFASILVVMIPLALMVLTQRIVEPVVSPWLPDTPEAGTAAGGSPEG